MARVLAFLALLSSLLVASYGQKLWILNKWKEFHREDGPQSGHKLRISSSPGVARMNPVMSYKMVRSDVSTSLGGVARMNPVMSYKMVRSDVSTSLGGTLMRMIHKEIENNKILIGEQESPPTSQSDSKKRLLVSNEIGQDFQQTSQFKIPALDSDHSREQSVGNDLGNGLDSEQPTKLGNAVINDVQREKLGTGRSDAEGVGLGSKSDLESPLVPDQALIEKLDPQVLVNVPLVNDLFEQEEPGLGLGDTPVSDPISVDGSGSGLGDSPMSDIDMDKDSGSEPGNTIVSEISGDSASWSGLGNAVESDHYEDQGSGSGLSIAVKYDLHRVEESGSGSGDALNPDLFQGQKSELGSGNDQPVSDLNEYSGSGSGHGAALFSDHGNDQGSGSGVDIVPSPGFYKSEGF